jgi:hypothetical protein
MDGEDDVGVAGVDDEQHGLGPGPEEDFPGSKSFDTIFHVQQQFAGGREAGEGARGRLGEAVHLNFRADRVGAL